MEQAVQHSDVSETENLLNTVPTVKAKRASSNKKQYIADIETRTGINFSKYQTDELVDSMGTIVSNVTPWGIAGIIIKNIAILFLLGSLILIAMGFLIGVQKLFITTVIVLVCLFPLLLIPATLISFSNSMAANSKAILSCSIDLAATILEDMDRFENLEIAEPSSSDVIRGVLYFSILPALSKALNKRFSLIAKPVIWILDKTVLTAAEFILRKMEKSEKGKEILDEKLSESQFSEVSEQVVAVAKVVQGKIAKADKFKKPMRQIIAIKPKLELFLFKSLFPKLQFPLRAWLFVGLFVQLTFCFTMVIIHNHITPDTPKEIHSSK